jgi:hypothetical protein
MDVNARRGKARYQWSWQKLRRSMFLRGRKGRVVVQPKIGPIMLVLEVVKDLEGEGVVVRGYGGGCGIAGEEGCEG